MRTIPLSLTMKTEQIIKTLQAHNDWRRDKINTTEYFDTISSHEIGLALDAAIERLQTLEKERDEARYIASYWRNPTKISDIKMET